MTRFLKLAILGALSSTVVLTARAQDRDITAMPTALDLIAQEAGGSGDPATSQQEGGENASRVPFRTLPARTPGRDTGAPELPELSGAALDNVSQVGIPSFRFADTPIEDALRQIARYLPMPLYVHLNGSRLITGEWKSRIAQRVLEDLSHIYGYTLRMSASGYTFEEVTRAIPVPSAVVAKAKGTVKDMSCNETSRPRNAVPESKLQRTMNEIEVERLKLLRQREALLETQR